MGGMGIMSVAKPMMNEVILTCSYYFCHYILIVYPQVFSGALPEVVTSSFAAQFLLILAAANLG
jgi:hypothetical protein